MTERPARERLIDAAERLIAENGADVSLNDIASAADQRNKSAVQYYFGSRDGLIRAVIEDRLRPLEKRRLDLLAEHEASGAADDVVTLVRILIAPMLELPNQQGAAHYARFLDTVRSHPLLADTNQFDAADQPAVRIIIGRLSRALGELPLARRELRLKSMASAMFALIADNERSRGGKPLTPAKAAAAADEIACMLAGLLTA